MTLKVIVEIFDVDRFQNLADEYYDGDIEEAIRAELGISPDSGFDIVVIKEDEDDT